MIISHKWKYIFIGIPYSASTAISKELVEKYDGKAILGKHSNVTDLIAVGFDISEYFIFAVFRNPLEISYSIYTKMIKNSREEYTNSEYFVENGGWVSKKARRVYELVHTNNLSFEAFLRENYKIPYDSMYSLNKKYLDCVIDFNDLNSSFYQCLKEIGLSPVRDLPMFNNTLGKSAHAVDMELEKKIFGPYRWFQNNEQMTFSTTLLFSSIIYLLVQPIRKLVWKRKDIQRRNRTVAGNKDFLED